MRRLESRKFYKLLFLLSVLFFLTPNFSLAQSVGFNEVAWMGSTSSSHSEWLELFNFSTSSVDISTWSIYGADTGECLNFSEADGTSSVEIASDDYLIYANSEDIFPGIEVDIWDASIGLNNSNPGDLRLFNNYNCGEGVGVVIDEVNNTEEWIAGDSVDYKTMERFNLDTWQTSLVSGGTPGQENSVFNLSESDNEEENEEEDDNYAELGSSGASYSVISSEKKSYSSGDILINEIVSDPEEGEEEWLELKSNYNSEINLEDWIIEEGSASQTKLEGTLKSNDYIVISDLSGNLNNKGDIVILKDPSENIIDQVSYGDYNSEINSPSEPFSLSRNDEGAWHVTESVTKGERNIIKLPNQEEGRSVKKESIVINEIFPNPKGSDHEKEFIELYNKSEKEVDLTAWWLENKSGRYYKFGLYDEALKISGKAYLVLYRKISHIPLNNNGDEIKLFSPNRKSPVQVLSYDKVDEGLSYSDTKNIESKNISSSTLLFFQNSTKREEWVWSKIKTPGKSNDIEMINIAPRVYFSYATPIYAKENVFFDSSDSFDENGDDLKFKWDFGDGVKLDLAFPDHVFLNPGEYRIVLSVSDGFSTTSESKKVEVLDGEDKTEEVKDPSASSGQADSMPEDGQVEESAQSAFGAADESLARDSNTKNYVADDSLNSNYSLVALEDIKNYSEGMSVLTRGKVAVEPGILASQYFYIVGSPGIQVYNYFKDFPDLKVGDYVQVKGEIALSRGEMRIKTRDSEDIMIIENQDEPIPNNLKCSQIGEDYVGFLVSLEGIITEKKSNKLYLDDDTGEVLVYIQEGAGINIKSLKEGDRVSLTGIINNYDGLIRIMPRSVDDIEILENKDKEKIDKDKDKAKVLGDKASSSLVLPARSSKMSLEIYIIIILILIILIFVFYTFFNKEEK